MIGFYDSGIGGLNTLRIYKENFPDYDYIFLADNKNFPLGEKTPEEIQEATFKGLQWLFDNGASIVIIACNTAAAYSIRKRQSLYPNKYKTLSVTIPGIEELLNIGIENKEIGILATQATIFSGIYNDLFHRVGGKGSPIFHFIIERELVRLAEEGKFDIEKINEAVQKPLGRMPDNTDILILGCTHFSIFKDYFNQYFTGTIIDPSYESMTKFEDYISRHPEIEKSISRKGTVKLFTTGENNYKENSLQKNYSFELDFEMVEL